MELYGFISESELNCFEMLIGVSGVGPKAALAILSSNTPEGLATAIVIWQRKGADRPRQGIGKKIAQRIILELKDKLAKGQLTVSGGEAFAGRYDHYSRGQDPARPPPPWRCWGTASRRSA